jgi:hypothetical protein
VSGLSKVCHGLREVDLCAAAISQMIYNFINAAAFLASAAALTSRTSWPFRVTLLMSSSKGTPIVDAHLNFASLQPVATRRARHPPFARA